MTRRHDLILAGLLVELLALVFLGVLAWAQIRGFDPSYCVQVGGCEWRHA